MKHDRPHRKHNSHSDIRYKREAITCLVNAYRSQKNFEQGNMRGSTSDTVLRWCDTLREALDGFELPKLKDMVDMCKTDHDECMKQLTSIVDAELPNSVIKYVRRGARHVAGPVLF